MENIIRCKTVKLLKDDTGKSQSDPGFGDDFLNTKDMISERELVSWISLKGEWKKQSREKILNKNLGKGLAPLKTK